MRNKSLQFDMKGFCGRGLFVTDKVVNKNRLKSTVGWDEVRTVSTNFRCLISP